MLIYRYTILCVLFSLRTHLRRASCLLTSMALYGTPLTLHASAKSISAVYRLCRPTSLSLCAHPRRVSSLEQQLATIEALSLCTYLREVSVVSILSYSWKSTLTSHTSAKSIDRDVRVGFSYVTLTLHTSAKSIGLNLPFTQFCRTLTLCASAKSVAMILRFSRWIARLSLCAHLQRVSYALEFLKTTLALSLCAHLQRVSRRLTTEAQVSILSLCAHLQRVSANLHKSHAGTSAKSHDTSREYV